MLSYKDFWKMGLNIHINSDKKCIRHTFTQYIYYYLVVLYKSRKNLSGNFPLKFQCHLLFSDKIPKRIVVINGADGIFLAFLQLSCSRTRNSFCKNSKATDFSSQNSEKNLDWNFCRIRGADDFK